MNREGGAGVPDRPPWWGSVSDRSTEDRLLVFNFLWALAHLGHLMRKGSLDNPSSWLLLLAAVLLLGNPRSRGLLALMASTQLLSLFIRMPFADNHFYVMGFVNAGLLATLVTGWSRERRGEAPGTEGGLTYVRVTLLAAYSAAALAKLNRGFFNPSESCAVTMFYDAAGALGLQAGFLPRTLEGLLPFFIAGVELAIPLLLLIPATRILGVMVVVLFHWAMSLSPMATAVDFTLMLFAPLFLFLPAAAAAEARDCLDRCFSGLSRLPGKAPVARTLLRVGAFGVLGALMVLAPGTVAGNQNWLLVAPAALLVGGGLIVLAWTSLTSGSSVRLSWKLPWVHAPLVALLLLNAGSPYLGIKTAGTFTMYSNLETANRQSNHYLFPRMPIETRYDDLIQLVDASNARLRRVARSGLYISRHEVRRHLWSNPSVQISYVDGGGELVVLNDAGRVPEFALETPLVYQLIPQAVHERFPTDRLPPTLAHWIIGYREHDPLARCAW